MWTLRYLCIHLFFQTMLLINSQLPQDTLSFQYSKYLPDFEDVQGKRPTRDSKYLVLKYAFKESISFCVSQFSFVDGKNSQKLACIPDLCHDDNCSKRILSLKMDINDILSRFLHDTLIQKSQIKEVSFISRIENELVSTSLGKEATEPLKSYFSFVQRKIQIISKKISRKNTEGRFNELRSCQKQGTLVIDFGNEDSPCNSSNDLPGVEDDGIPRELLKIIIFLPSESPKESIKTSFNKISEIKSFEISKNASNFDINIGNSASKSVSEEDVSKDKPKRILQEVESFFADSNIFKLGNISAFKTFDFFSSPVFYIVLGLSVMMIGVSCWSVKQDKKLDRDFLKMPHKSPSRTYRILVYISVYSFFNMKLLNFQKICHTFFGIFTLFDKERPRIMRSVLFYTKMLGVMAVSTIFNQTRAELNQVAKIAISMFTLLIVTPVNLTLQYLVFKRNIEPKKRRKRLMLQTRKAQTLIEDKEEEMRKEKRKKEITKILNILGYGLVISIILGYNYVIFVITAVNTQVDKSMVNKWILAFVQSTGMDFCGVQIIKTMVHLGVISTLENENKKKFLCIPRKFLPKLLNADIFDYKKRFAALDSLYLKTGKYNIEISTNENLEPSMSAIRTEQNASDKFILRNGHSSQYLNTNSNLDSQLQNPNLDTLNTGTERKITFESSRMDSSKLKIEEVNELDSLEASIIERRKARSLQINKLKSNRKLMMRR